MRGGLGAWAFAGALLVAACASRSPSAQRAQPEPVPPPPLARAQPEPPPPPLSVESADAAIEPEPAPLALPGCVVGRKPGGDSLGELIAARRCLAPREKWIDAYDASAFSFSADPPSLSVQRGAHAELFVQIDVKAAKDELLQLRLGCLELVETAVYDAQGKRVDELGDPPDMLCMAEVVQVVVRAGDGASLRVPFVARRHTWKPLDVERRDAGPLPAGSFELRLRLPFWTAKGERIELRVPVEITR